MASLPHARVKKIVRRHPNVTSATSEAVFAISLATEHFLHNFVKEIHKSAVLSKRKTLKMIDVEDCIAHIPEFEFLDGSLEGWDDEPRPKLVPQPSTTTASLRDGVPKDAGDVMPAGDARLDVGLRKRKRGRPPTKRVDAEICGEATKPATDENRDPERDDEDAPESVSLQVASLCADEIVEKAAAVSISCGFENIETIASSSGIIKVTETTVFDGAPVEIDDELWTDRENVDRSSCLVSNDGEAVDVDGDEVVGNSDVDGELGPGGYSDDSEQGRRSEDDDGDEAD